jgi:gamma-glutamylaminecyclotransferase
MPYLVFVFGTLKEGFPNFQSNRGVRLPGEFLTEQRLPLYLVGERHSPWLVNLPGQGHRITGQVFEVDRAALDRMDELERVTEPDGYRRLTLSVVAKTPSATLAAPVFAYLKQPEQVSAAGVRLGPLAEYTLEHAALYRSRAPLGRGPL